MKPTTTELRQMYTQWLKGESLRQIARKHGVMHGTVHQWFRKEFGDKACNLVATSLVRSLLEDYEDSQDVLSWALQLVDSQVIETTQHRSKHSINMLTNYQTLDETELWDTIAVYEKTESALDFLRLPLFLLFANLLSIVLWVALND